MDTAFTQNKTDKNSTQIDTSVSKESVVAKKRRKTNYLFLPYSLGRGNFLKWLRRTHAWLGLWGALLGIMFGVTGILLNHRGTWKIPAAKTTKTKVELAIPTLFADSQNFAAWLKQELKVPENWQQSLKVNKAEEISWNGKSVTQPERWRATFYSPQSSYSATYWVGNGFATIQKFDRNLFALLNRMHMASGMGIGWILLADSIAGSFILLSLTGILLWTRLHGPRLLAAGLVLTSLLVTLFNIVPMM